MPNPASPQVAVSYAWKEESGGDNAKAVDGFCERLRDAGIAVVRDVDRLRHGECISRFMRSIGASDFLCVFLSEAYLKSSNCMYELLVAWQRSKDNPDEFRSRVKVWVMPGAEIRGAEQRLDYSNHWKGERDRLAALVKDHATDGLASAELEGFRRIKQFAEHVNEMLCFFADTLSPQSADDFQNWIQEKFRGWGEVQLVQVYEHTAAEIEAVLNGNPRLTEFLNTATAGLISRESGRWHLATVVKSSAFDAVPHLKGIKERMYQFTGTRSDWSDLEVVVGGLVVMAVDPGWILTQRRLLRSGSVEYPALKDFVPIGQGQRANFLHLVSASLADGTARLHRIFGSPDVSERRAPDPPLVFKGITETDRNTELKVHFIRYVLGSDVEVDPSKTDDVEQLFRRVNDVMRFALTEERDPFFGTGAAFKKLGDTIRGQLRMDDLLLIHPSGTGAEEKIFSNPIFVLKYLHSIFQFIQTKRSSLPS